MKTIYLWLGKLPLPALYVLANLGYYLIYYVIRYRRSVVRDNLVHAFPEKSQAERLAIERAFFRFLCDNTAEVVHAQRMSAQDILDRVEFTNIEAIQPYLDQKQPMQFLSIHQGNWEWVAQTLSARLNMPIDLIYKPLHDPAMDELFLKARSQFGSTPLSSKVATKQLLRQRREFRAFVMTAEQAPIRRDKKYWRVFFNRPAPFYMGPQVIAELTKHPVIYVKLHRVKRGYYRLSFEVIATPPYERNSFTVLESYIDAMERAIREQPETWLWSNRKWRKKPVVEENASFAEDFPEELKINP